MFGSLTINLNGDFGSLKLRILGKIDVKFKVFRLLNDESSFPIDLLKYPNPPPLRPKTQLKLYQR
jgi:hypothetical protein